MVVTGQVNASEDEVSSKAIELRLRLGHLPWDGRGRVVQVPEIDREAELARHPRPFYQ